MSGEFLPVMDFGIRSVPPCEDCWEDGHCSMNCGPAVKTDYSNKKEKKVSEIAQKRPSVAQNLRKIAKDMRKVAPDVGELSPANAGQMLGAADMLDDWAEEIENV